LISEDSSEEGTSDNGEPRRDKKGNNVNRQADEDEEDSRAARQKAVSVPDSKEPIFEVDEEGNANVAVFDSLEMRAAFLHYCRSPILAHEMHMAPVIPQMSVPQFTAMARDMKIVEPDGELNSSGATSLSSLPLSVIVHRPPLPHFTRAHVHHDQGG
jgi:hypothetical protein